MAHSHDGHDHSGIGHSHAPADFGRAFAVGIVLNSVFIAAELLEQRDYGGNLLSVIYANLYRPTSHPPSPPADFDAAIARLLDAEDALLAAGQLSFHSVILATPKPGR